MTGSECAAAVFEGIRKCTHVAEEDLSEIERLLGEVLWWEYDEDGWGGGRAAFMATLKDGRVVVASEWREPSGHGGECDGEVQTFPSIAEAVRLGLIQRQREDFQRKDEHK